MKAAYLCHVWSGHSSVSAIGAFAASSKPPQKTLSCLRNTSRDIRLVIAEPLVASWSSTSVALSALSSSHSAAAVPPTSPNSTSNLLAAVRGGQLDLAVAEYKRLQSRHALLEPDLVEELITALLKTKKVQAALAVYETSQKGQVPPILHYNTFQYLVTAAIKAAQPYTALDIFRQLQSAGYNANCVTYCGLISALGKVRRRGQPSADLAYQLWQEMYAADMSGLDATAYRTGMNACISVGKLSEAKQVLQNMKDRNIPVDIKAYNILLKGLSRKGDTKAIPGVLEEMQQAKVKPTSVTYNTLINSYVEDGQHDEARRVCADAQDAGMALDVWTYSALIKGFVQSDQLDSALDMFKEMKAANQVKPNEVTYNTLINGCVRAGNIDTGRALVSEMLATGVEPNVVTYNTLLRASAAAEQAEMQASFGMLSEMTAAGVIPTVDTFNTLMDVCASRHDYEAVVRLFRHMVQSGHSPDAVSYTTLITAHSRLGHSADALQAFQELDASPTAQADLYAFNAVISALAVAGRMRQAEAYLQRAAQMAGEQEIGPPVEAFGAVIKGYCRLNEATAALDVMREFWQQGGDPDDSMFESLVNVCVRTGEFKKALQVVRAMDKLGRPADKMRVKKVLEEFYKREEKMKRSKTKYKPVNEGLQRFKFWLGLPNQYYYYRETEDG